MLTVYINSAGAINGINVMMALKKSELKIRFIAGDCDPLSAGLYVADSGYVVPRVNDPKFIPTVLDICRKEEVDVALPIYSADFPVFADHIKDFEHEGIRTYALTKEAWEICDSKFNVTKHLESIGISCPRTWTMERALMKRSSLPYPLFLKLNSSSGTKNVKILKTSHDLEYHASPEFIVQDFINGEEFTIDVLSDLKGRMMAASPRKRLKIYGGLSVCGVTIEDDEIVRLTKRIVESLKLPGPSNVQCKRDDEGILRFYDINPRFASGGLPLAVAAGL
ncbi:unnamed protein product, partial [marine sediment metagenome]